MPALEGRAATGRPGRVVPALVDRAGRTMRGADQEATCAIPRMTAMARCPLHASSARTEITAARTGPARRGRARSRTAKVRPVSLMGAVLVPTAASTDVADPRAAALLTASGP